MNRGIGPTVLLTALICLLCPPGLSAQPPEAPEAAGPRPVIVISDLHMGLGRDGAAWHPTEDFRWPRALAAFLDTISSRKTSGVDLIIAGDFLELWQLPKSIVCQGPAANAGSGDGAPPSTNAGGSYRDYGCTVAQMRAATSAVVAAHAAEFDALARFAAKGDNRLIVVPGNHDASLVIDEVWEIVAQALKAGGDHVLRQADGLWLSTDGRLLVEHGHQIGEDANKYSRWPAVSKVFGGVEYVRQPWGERFVQTIFNQEEAAYPLIDNLSPSSAGARYRMADRGLVGTAADVARFLRFNLGDTSLRQKAQILGEGSGDAPRWDKKRARKLGHHLFLGALPPDDPFAAAALQETGEWPELRRQLDAAAEQLPDEEIEALCDMLAIRGAAKTCSRPVLGAAASGLLISRKRTLTSHLHDRRRDHRRLGTFVYGHTHSFEIPWSARLSRVTKVQVANSGAFQRVIDDDRLQRLAAAEKTTPIELLKTSALEDLPPCYTFVEILWQGGRPAPSLHTWYMPENASVGRILDPCDPLCPNVGHGCRD